jgi:hypothetical protein
MYVERNIEGRLRNQSYSGKAISITYSECAILALGIQNAVRMRHIVICDVSGCTVAFHISHKRHDFRKKKTKNIYIYIKLKVSRDRQRWPKGFRIG